MPPWGVGQNSWILAPFSSPKPPPMQSPPFVCRAVCLSACPPFVGFSSRSDGAGCHGNCICLQDPQSAEPINPFPLTHLPDPAAIGSKQTGDLVPTTSSPWASLPPPFRASSHQVSSPLPIFPPLPFHFPLCLVSPLVCLSLWPGFTPGLSECPFLILYPNRLPLEGVPLPHFLWGPLLSGPLCLAPFLSPRTISLSLQLIVWGPCCPPWLPSLHLCPLRFWPPP